MSHPLKLLLLAIATLLMGALAVSNQSFWIDEGTAAMKAIQPTLALWWHALRLEGHSNLQLLPHLFYIWGWEKIFGSSEIALRAANVPLLFGGLAAALWGLAFRPRAQFWFCLLILMNAFTWYYLNEARPYIFLLAAACVPLACLVPLLDQPEKCVESRTWLPIFLAGLFLVSFTSLIAVPWAMAWALTAAWLIGLSSFWQLIRRRPAVCLLFATAMAGLGTYYLWTMSLGARASPVGGRSGLMTLPVVFYEQLGLFGLGPGRNELRQGGLATLRPYLPWLILGGAAFVAPVWSVAASGFWRDRRVRVLLLAGVIFPLLAVVGAGYVMHVRILGRHLAPLFPVIVFFLALGVQGWLEKRKRAGFVPVGFLLLILAFSSWQIRFAPRHARDDYRGAAALGEAALREGKSVWWAADKDTGQFYNFPPTNPGRETRTTPQIYPASADLLRLPYPDMIVLSKTDIYDPAGAIREYAKSRGFIVTRSLQSFQIWEKP